MRLVFPGSVLEITIEKVQPYDGMFFWAPGGDPMLYVGTPFPHDS